MTSNSFFITIDNTSCIDGILKKNTLSTKLLMFESGIKIQVNLNSIIEACFVCCRIFRFL